MVAKLNNNNMKTKLSLLKGTCVLVLSLGFLLTSCRKEVAKLVTDAPVSVVKKTRSLNNDSTKFKVLSYNTYEGFRGDSARIAKFKQWVDTLRPSVIAFQEMRSKLYL